MTNATGVTTLIDRVPHLDDKAMQEARERLDRLTKPRGSLGRLEDLAVLLAGITGRVRQQLANKAIVLMAADHGVVAEGVSAYPQAVTAQMVTNFLGGGAAISVLARQAGARVLVVDMGVAAELPRHPDLVSRKIASGTGNMARGPAMTRAQAEQAISNGIEIAAQEIARGADLLATGDMGIGNTTASSAVTAALLGCRVDAVTGRGAGLDDEGVARKIATIERALAINQPKAGDPIDVLAKVGGFEIAGLAGVILQSAAERVPVILDGFVSGAAALVACRLCPTLGDRLLAAHRSVEPGHGMILEALALEPLLDLDLRLGEGTGAALAMHLVDDALAVLDEMATFEEAGVADRPDA
ncbi:MAG: nicotinate-nucleotide--dimethylbenzimidazole phosphoribosyltransferase [Dehalococcoidia bacterium]